MPGKKNVIPEPTLRRLTAYLHYLEKCMMKGDTNISSLGIAEEMTLEPIQVRKDIAFTGVGGKPKAGYEIKDLIKGIRKCLNWDKPKMAFLAGAGHLGSALLGYKGFSMYGFNFVAAFDKDDEIINTVIHGIKVYPVEQITEMASMLKVNIGVLTVPGRSAQHITDMMIAGGINAILNFTPVRIKVPDGVIVEHAQLTQSLAVLTSKL